MVDVTDRRLTRSLSNELRQRLHSQSGLGLRSGRELSSNAIQSNGPPHHDPQEQQQQQPSGQQPQSTGMVNGVNMEEDSTYQRNTSEEMFLNTVINSSLAPGTPMIEAASLEFLDSGPPAQPRPTLPGETPRGDSEELFQTFLSTNVEHANGILSGVDTTPASDGNDLRGNFQSSGEEPHSAAWDARMHDVEQSNLGTDAFLPDDDDVLNVGSEHKSPSPRSNSLTKERGKPAGYNTRGPIKESNSSSPMTRSKLSELRRQFSQMEGPSQSPVKGSPESSLGPGMTPAGGSVNGKSNSGSPKTGSGLKSTRPQSLGESILSSASPVNYSQRVQQQADHQCHLISDAVGALKGSIERKKSQTRQQQQQQQLPSQAQQLDQPEEQPKCVVSDAVGALKGSIERKKFEAKQQQQVNQQQQWQNEQKPQQQQQAQQQRAQQQQQQRGKTGPQGTPRQDDVIGRAQDLREQLAMESDPGLGFPGQLMQDNVALTQSPTTSSAAAASHSAGIATSDGPSNSGLSGQRHGIKRGNGELHENGTAKADVSQKPDRLTRAGSITSALEPVYQLNDMDGATKKRRVERVRKMAEAKVRGHAPTLPADLQAALKRCDALEKEVRSLKHYLAFMNRKDSEQTKRIEELEEENEELRQLQNRLQEPERVPGKRERDVGAGKRTSANVPGFGNPRR